MAGGVLGGVEQQAERGRGQAGPTDLTRLRDALHDDRLLTELRSALAQFGAEELPREAYKTRLALALEAPAQFPVALDPVALVEEILALAER